MTGNRWKSGRILVGSPGFESWRGGIEQIRTVAKLANALGLNPMSPCGMRVQIPPVRPVSTAHEAERRGNRLLFGRLAGSNPVVGSQFRDVAQMARAPVSYAGCRWFDPTRLDHFCLTCGGREAMRRSAKPVHVGSTPTRTSMFPLGCSSNW